MNFSQVTIVLSNCPSQNKVVGFLKDAVVKQLCFVAVPFSFIIELLLQSIEEV